MLHRRCQPRLLTLPDGSHSEAGPAAFPGPTFDKAVSSNQAGVSQHAVLRDTTGSREKGHGRRQRSVGLSEEATLSHVGETEEGVQGAGRRKQQGWRKQGRDGEAAEKAGSEEERPGPQVPQEGLGAPACSPGTSPNLPLSLPRATLLLLTCLLRSWCPALGVKVTGHENSEHLTQGHV